MEFCSRSPFSFGAQYPQHSPTSLSLAQTLGGCGCQNQLTGPPAASPHSSCTHGRKQPQGEGSRSTSPCHSSPCCRAPSKACTRLTVLLPWELSSGLHVPNPYATVLRTMASTLEKFIHSLDLRALPRVLQIQSGIYCQGEHWVFSGRALQGCIWHQVPLQTEMWIVGEA